MPTGVYIRTEEYRKKISDRMKGKPRPYLLGRKHSEEHKRKISQALKGIMPKNIRMIKGWGKGKKRPEMTGENHPNLKGGINL